MVRLKITRLRVVVITQYVSKILESILESGHEVVGIIESAPARDLNPLLKAAGKSLTSTYYSFTSRPLNLRLFSKKMEIPYYYLKKGDDEGLERWIKNVDPDLIIIYSMSHLIKENVFNIPKFGTINLHNSYLPEYRGRTPIFWEYYDYVLNPGVTLHFVDKGEDTGDIIYQERIRISSGEKLEKVNQQLTFVGAKLILQMIKNIETGDIPRIKQPILSPTVKARRIKPEEYYGLIKWNDWDAERVFHFLNGTPRYHNTLLRKNRIYRFLFRIKILDLEKCDTAGYKVGTLYKENSKYFFVCRDGKIYVSIRPSTVYLSAWLYPFIS